MSDMSDIFEKVKTFLDDAGLDGESANLESHLENDLCAEVVDILLVCEDLEDHYDIDIPHGDFASWDTVQDVVNTVHRLLSN
ncbi:acyl carrier protein (plasmid) [Paenibacillus sp. EC2-1]|uniref:acyl carrier protein n=1 Tax=Paenibacillus sp. EC2-1 TaxID=3388665 RepID=UPI003BEEE45A